MKYTTFASLAVVTALGFLTPMHANAFGLGKIELSSALNEPFKAEIGVTALRDDDAENLEIRLASNAEFIKAGLERSLILTQLKFELVEKPNGLVILVSSKQAVKEPILDFLLTATTGEGKLIREYTVLLDPPKDVFNRPTKTTTIPSTPAPTSKSATIKSTSGQNTTSYQYPSADLSTATSYGPTGRTDTLWDIALKTRPQTAVSVHQMMMAILKENPRAFTKNNINGLKAGYTLDLPSVEIIERLSQALAVAAVSEQNTAWKNRNASSVQASETTTIAQADVQGPDTEQQGKSDSSEVSDTAEVSAAVEENTDTEAKLKLVVPADESSINDDDLSLSGNEELRKLSEQLTLAEETLEGQVQENIEFKARMSAMEEQLETMRRLISLKDADLARLQSSLEQEEGIVAESSEAEATEEMTSLHEEAIALLDQYASDVESSESESLEQTAADEMASLEDDEMVIDEMLSDDALESGVAATEQVVDETILDEMDLSSVPFAEDIISKTSDLMDVDEGEIKSGLAKVKQFVEAHKIETALGGVLVLLLLLLFIRNRKNAGVSWDEAVDKLDDKPAPVSEAPVVMKSQQTEEDEIAEESQSDDEFSVKTAEDLIEQADIFVGYADYEQAKTSLDLAKQMEPGNEKVIQKLLFVSFKQEDVNTFVELASQTTVDKGSAEWEEISSWGRDIAPEHELFKLDEMDVELASEPADVEDDSNDSVDDEPLNVATEEIEEINDLEFNLDEINTADDDGTSELSADDIENTLSDDSDDELLAFNINTDENDSDIDIEVSPINEISDEENSDSFDALNLDDELSDFDAPLAMDNSSLGDDETPELNDEPMTLDISEADTSIGTIELGELGAISEDELDAATRELSESLDDTLEMEGTADSADLKFDIGEIDEIDESETKLDLAAAYIDMGDPEGAKSILEEVMNDANDEQKERAQGMLNDL